MTNEERSAQELERVRALLEKLKRLANGGAR